MTNRILTTSPSAISTWMLALLALFGDFQSIQSGALEASIPFAPQYLVVSNRTTIVYEMHVVNKHLSRISIDELLIKNEKGQTIKSLKSDDLKRKFQAEPSENAATTPSLSSGAHTVIYLEIVLNDKTLPEFLDHILLSNDSSSGTIFTDHIRTVLTRKSALVLDHPLQSGHWAAIYNPEWTRGHRRVIFNKNGIDRIPGRFAIDFIKLDNEGHYAKGDENLITNWYGYGAEVLAVADGVVCSVRDDFQESKTISDHPKYPADLATGNYISIKVDNDHFVFYEHLKPQSILVKNGQAVKKGQLIAKLGFTGQTTGPHLHLHVANIDSPLRAEGVPFVFNKFELTGTYPDFNIFGKSRWTDSSKVVTNEHPSSNSVIRFK